MDQLVAILLSLILSVTGINRTVDPVLVADAQRRVVEIQTDWRHNGTTPYEVLHFNQYASDPVATAIQAWQNSPDHWRVLTYRGFTRIGCAIDVDETMTYWFACSFGESVVQLEPKVEPRVVLPDTAMSDE